MTSGGSRPGTVGAVAALATAAGALLWLSMLVAPWRLVAGLSDARTHLRKAENALKSGALKEANYETLAAIASAKRARAGLRAGGPLFDLARSAPAARDLLDEVPHLVAATEHASAAGRGTLEIAETALRGPEPLIEHDTEDPEASARIRLDRVDDMHDKVMRIRANVAKARRELEAIRVENLPRRLRPDVATGIEDAADADRLLARAEAGFEILPSVLGAETPRTYLLAMQNSAELRGTGGAILRFAQLRFDDGEPSFVKGKTVYRVDIRREPISIPLPDDAWYVNGIEDARRFGNANWSPDWPLSARLTVEYAEASSRIHPDLDVPDVDGVIAVDPIALDMMLEGAGKVTSRGGRTINRRNAIPFLFHKAYQQFPNPGVRRALLNQIVDSFYAGVISPDKPTKLVQAMADALTRKHVQVWMEDPAEQAFIERMDWDAGIRDAEGSDYLYVVQQNVGGNKLNYVERQQHSMTVRLEGNDALVSTAVRIVNPVEYPNPRYWLGDSHGKHRPMLNVYVPGNARLRDHDVPQPCPASPNDFYASACRLDVPAPAMWVDGEVAEHEEMGKKVWTATLQIPPGGTGDLRLDYVVPGVVRTVGDRLVYRLVLQHQPKIHPERMTVAIDVPSGATGIRAAGLRRAGGTLVWQGALDKDRVLEVSWRS